VANASLAPTLSPEDLFSDSIDTQQETDETLRQRSRESLYFFARAVLFFKDLTPAVHMEPCKLVQDPRLNRLLVMMPRGGLKSSTFTMAYAIWLLIQEPDDWYFFGCNERILIANASAENAEHFVRMIEAIFDSNPLFRRLFPELIPLPGGKWSERAMDVRRTRTFPESTIEAIGVGGRITSRHYTKIILDDLVEVESAKSLARMRGTISWWKFTESLLEIAERDKTVVVGTRWAPNEFVNDDLYSHIMDHDKSYEVYQKSAYVEDGQGGLTSYWPQRFSMKFLQALQKKDPVVFACQYLNDPIHSSVTEFKWEWLEKYEIRNQRICVHNPLTEEWDRGPELMNLNRYLLIDPALSSSASACQTAMIVVGLDTEERVFLLDLWAATVGHEEIPHQFVLLVKRWRPTVIIEDVLFQKLLKPIFERAMEDEKVYAPITLVRPFGKKIPRIRDSLSNLFHSGKFHVNE